MIKATAPAKVILFGEHSVVYDKTGIAGAVAIHSTASIKEAETPKIILKNFNQAQEFSFSEITQLKQEADKLIQNKEYSKLKKISDNPLKLTELVIAKAMEGKQTKPFELSIGSEVPRGGFGSSSSVFSAATAAIQYFLSGKINKKEVSETANYGDIGAHGGTPSGIDASTITYGGFIEYRKSKGIKPLEMNTKLPIVIGNTGIPARTSETVTKVRELRSNKPKETNKVLNEMGEIAIKGIEAIKKGNLEEVGKLMNKNQEALRKLEISHPLLEKLINASLDAGALGAKLTGGGGGGIMIALCENEEAQEKVAKAILNKKRTPIITELGAEGVRIVK